MTKMNSFDERLILALQEDARQSSEVLAAQLGASPSTVRRRVRKLIQSGVLRAVGVVDPVKAGFPLVCIIAFDVAHDKLESAMQFLANRPEVKWLSTTTGRFDIVALVRFRSTDELTTFIQKEISSIEEIRSSETFICLEMRKGRYIQI